MELSFFEANPSSPPVPGERDLSPPQPLPAGWARVAVGGPGSFRPFYSAQDASKSGQDTSKSARIASKMPVKRLLDAFSVDDTIRTPFWTHVRRQEGALRHEKSLKSLQLSLKIKVSASSAKVAFGALFGELLGSILGAFWPPDGSNMASRAPKTAPRRPRERSRRLLYASRTAPAPPKTTPRPPLARLRCP